MYTLGMPFTAKHLLLSLSLWLLRLTATDLFAAAADVRWHGNDNVRPEHEAAHNAPRSQKYWDEHGIERPDYAKTDAEVAAERRRDGGGGSGWFGMALVASAIIAIAGAIYVKVTGDWDTVLNIPVTSFVVDCAKRIPEVAGMKGHKLGSATDTGNNVASDEDARRLARLARFDNPNNPKNMLDSMKAD
ncbi:hypothetical protein ACHAWF_008324 [Thalassiosira exigua]